MSAMTSATAINVYQLINKTKFTPYQWLIFLFCFFIVLADGFNTGVMGFIAPTLMQEWGISRSEIGFALSAALAGMVIGALTVGPLADKWGRKNTVILSVFFFSLFSVLSAFSPNLPLLLLCRLLTGIGLGASMPVAATLLAEYVPLRWRSTLINGIFCAFPGGFALAGFVSALLTTPYGWWAPLLVGGVVPMIIAVFMLFLLPESVQYLLLKQRSPARVSAILNRVLCLQLPPDQAYITLSSGSPQQASVKQILSAEYLLSTLMFWLTCFMSLAAFYVLTGWLPIILRSADFTDSQASLMTSLFPVGGAIGALIIGWLMDKTHANRTLMFSYILAGLLMFLTGITYGNSLILFALCLFLTGALVGGAQSSITALTTGCYPPQMRATGVSWMHGTGRIGAIVGAFLGAPLLLLEFHIIFTILSAAVFVCALALWLRRRQKPFHLLVRN
ncbi:MAG: MFS transporter [Enterobacteriaceae bacterium]